MAYSSTAIGTAFERHALKFLNHHLNMSLTRVGRAGDQGIDLRGWWWLPQQALRDPTASSSTSTLSSMDLNRNMDRKGKGKALEAVHELVRMRVVGQCKAHSAKVGPRDVRELEGVMAGLRLWRE